MVLVRHFLLLVDISEHVVELSLVLFSATFYRGRYAGHHLILVNIDLLYLLRNTVTADLIKTYVVVSPIVRYLRVYRAYNVVGLVVGVTSTVVAHPTLAVASIAVVLAH